MSAFNKASVLIVEDVVPVARIYRHFFTQMGFRDIDVTSNGGEALAALKDRRYDVIISDWHMEPVTGFELLQHVRSKHENDDVAFILATIESRARYIKAATLAGVSEYILKPFTKTTLHAALVKACPNLAMIIDAPKDFNEHLDLKQGHPNHQTSLCFQTDRSSVLSRRPAKALESDLVNLVGVAPGHAVLDSMSLSQ